MLTLTIFPPPASAMLELKNPISQLDNSEESLTSKMNQANDRILVLLDKVADLDQINKEYIFKAQRRNMNETRVNIKKPNLKS